MNKRIAIITDAISPNFWFPKWYKYYGDQFGESNIYMVTYQGKSTTFDNYSPGGIWDIPCPYCDELRAKVISALVRTLLLTHDTVIRCDVDEFLVPDLRIYKNLHDYISRSRLPYVTAYGIDVFERDGDAPLDINRPILISQRSHGIAISASHKTAVTTKPLEWASGFHGSTVVPVFDLLYMFHMKFADVDGRSEWLLHMKAGVAEGSSEHTYFSFTNTQMQAHKNWLSRIPCSPEGWTIMSDAGDREKFLTSVSLSSTGIYQGQFKDAAVAFIIPEIFRDAA